MNVGALKKQEASGDGQSAMGVGQSAVGVAAAPTAPAAAPRLVIPIMLMLTIPARHTHRKIRKIQAMAFKPRTANYRSITEATATLLKLP